MDLTFIIRKIVELDTNFLELAQHYRHSSIPEAGYAVNDVHVCERGWEWVCAYELAFIECLLFMVETMLIIMWARSCEMKSILQMGK